MRTDPLAGVRLDKQQVSVYLTDMDTLTSNSVRVPSRPMFEREPDVETNTSPRSKLTVVGVNRRSAENRVPQVLLFLVVAVVVRQSVDLSLHFPGTALPYLVVLCHTRLCEAHSSCRQA